MTTLVLAAVGFSLLAGFAVAFGLIAMVSFIARTTLLSAAHPVRTIQAPEHPADLPPAARLWRAARSWRARPATPR
jgi:hypothetical protein